MVGQNGGVRGIDSHVGYADIGVSRDVDLKRGAGVKWRVGADAKDSMKVRRIRRSRVHRNHYRAVDLTTGYFEHSCQRDRGHPAHTSETHRHPEEEVLVRMIKLA